MRRVLSKGRFWFAKVGRVMGILKEKGMRFGSIPTEAGEPIENVWHQILKDVCPKNGFRQTKV